jgi:hypothetical protein
MSEPVLCKNALLRFARPEKMRGSSLAVSEKMDRFVW